MKQKDEIDDDDDNEQGKIIGFRYLSISLDQYSEMLYILF